MTIIEDGYARYRRLCLDAGLPETEIDAEIAKMKRETAALDMGRCPKCNAKISRQRDEPSLPGTWFNYRCAACKYMVDRCEVERPS